MSTAEENVAAVRRYTEALEGGDLEAARAEMTPDVEIDDHDLPDADRRDSFDSWIGRWNDSFDSWRTEEAEVLAEGDRVVTLFRMVATGRESGIELARDDALIVDFRDGKIARIGYYNDQAEAIRAAGLGSG